MTSANQPPLLEVLSELRNFVAPAGSSVDQAAVLRLFEPGELAHEMAVREDYGDMIRMLHRSITDL